jgi:hypothetical protein
MTWHDGELMDSPVRPNDPPPGAVEHPTHLGKQESTVEGLIRSGSGWAASKPRVNAIEPHGVEIVRRCEKEHAACPADAGHFLDGCERAGKMFDGLAGNYNVKRLAGKGEGVGIGLRVAEARAPAIALVFFLGDAEGSLGKIRTEGDRSPGCKKSRKPSPATSDFEYTLALDGRKVFENEFVPRSFLVPALGIGIENPLVPFIVFRSEVHKSGR